MSILETALIMHNMPHQKKRNLAEQIIENTLNSKELLGKPKYAH